MIVLVNDSMDSCRPLQRVQVGIDAITKVGAQARLLHLIESISLDKVLFGRVQDLNPHSVRFRTRSFISSKETNVASPASICRCRSSRTRLCQSGTGMWSSCFESDRQIASIARSFSPTVI